MSSRDSLSFRLYPSCILVKGTSRDAIYDLQRQSYHFVPQSISEVISTQKKQKTIRDVKTLYPNESDTIDEYINFLLEQDYGILAPIDECIFKEISTTVSSPSLITNAIFDYNCQSTYNLHIAIDQLHDIGCENLEIRFYDKIPTSQLEEILIHTQGTILRNIELMIQYDTQYSIERIIELRLKYSRLRKMTLVSCPKVEERVYSHDDLYVIFTSEEIKDETHCGVISPWYLLPKTELYLESISHNTCLNAKISIDSYGNIKNCPSMANSWGCFGEVKLLDVATNPNFQKYWSINKDQIEGCCGCELRHMCQDCRAYINDPNNILSKPIKCSYTP